MDTYVGQATIKLSLTTLVMSIEDGARAIDLWAMFLLTMSYLINSLIHVPRRSVRMALIYRLTRAKEAGE
jgi:hypothetical protein